MMKRLAVILVLSVFCFHAQAQTGLTESYAQLKFKEGRFDFGTTPRDSVLVHEFEFENTGNAPLWLISAGTSCPCTTIQFDRDTIPPGGVGKVVVTYRETRQTLGRFNQYATIASNALREIQRIYISGIKEE